ncbi:MAG: hypothetical protein ACK4NC_07255 [Candidatus Gracilibacteria bacterium]
MKFNLEGIDMLQEKDFLSLLSSSSLSPHLIKKILDGLRGTPYYLAATRIIADNQFLSEELTSELLTLGDPLTTRNLIRRNPSVINRIVIDLSVEDWLWIIATTGVVPSQSDLVNLNDARKLWNT